MTCEKGVEFSAVVEDCVGIGRFAGAGVIAHIPRKNEPVLFRHCYFMNLDRWGDAGGVYVRGESKTMPDCPHATFEDCTIIGPDRALQAGYPGVDNLACASSSRFAVSSCSISRNRAARRRRASSVAGVRMASSFTWTSRTAR